MKRYYINGEERSLKAFEAFDHAVYVSKDKTYGDKDNPLIHFVIVDEENNKTTQWGRMPSIKINKEDK